MEVFEKALGYVQDKPDVYKAGLSMNIALAHRRMGNYQREQEDYLKLLDTHLRFGFRLIL